MTPKFAPLAVVAAATLGLTASLAAGCGDTATVTTTEPAQTIIRAETMTVARTTETKTEVQTVTEPPKATDTFEGAGSRRLPPLTVKQNSTLKWTNDGTLFQLHDVDYEGSVDVSSEGAEGETYLPAGSYELEVGAAGNWTIEIVPAE